MKRHRLSAVGYQWLAAWAVIGVLGPRSVSAQGATYPAPVESTFVVRDFRFASGESLAELRLHYATLGTPQRDAQGVVRNAVLVLHGTGGSGRG